MRKRIPLFAAFALGALAVWGYFQIFNARWVLKNSDQLVLYSLKPRADYKSADWNSKAPRERFHKVMVLGKVVINDPEIKHKIIDALEISLNEAAPQAACFDPRHGLRAVRGNRTIDVSICFECSTAVFYEGEKEKWLPISDSARAVFNQILDDAKIPRSEPRP